MEERLFGLVGYPLGHSFSKQFFTQKFKKLGINASYRLFEMPDLTALSGILDSEPSLEGFNVTIPHKESILAYLHTIDPIALQVGAVNTVKVTHVNGDVQLTGFNTDVFGFNQSLKPLLRPHHERALILGTGGAAKAVYHVLTQLGIDCYYVSRNPTNVKSDHVFGYPDLNEYILSAFNLIVNTTPLGMHPNLAECPDIPYHLIGTSHLVYDLIYNPADTLFMQKAKARGAQVENGWGMLQHQAEEAWRIWNV